jgi:hypothetical protein
MNPKSYRKLNNSSRVAAIFWKELGTNEAVDFTTQNIEDLMNEQALDSALASNSRNKTLRRDWKATHRLTSFQFLDALQTSLTAR